VRVSSSPLSGDVGVTLSTGASRRTVETTGIKGAAGAVSASGSARRRGPFEAVGGAVSGCRRTTAFRVERS
jgi:hypothetical protein